MLAMAGAIALPAQAAVASAQQPPTPIPSVAIPPPPPYIGRPATARPVVHSGAIPSNRHMAANGLSEIHDDGWQSDVYTWDGPLGRSPQTLSSYLATSGTPGIGRDCGSITFDREGRVISICIGLSGPELYMFDPRTLATLATFSLPPRTAEDVMLNPGTKIFQDFSAGGYFYLDNRDEVVTSTTTQQIYVIGEAPGSPGFRLLHDYSLSGVLAPNEEITSQLPDSHGLEWFTARQDGVVGTLNLATGAIHVVRLGDGPDGEITKSLAIDARGGVYIPTNHRLYRFVAGRGGAPRISWQVAYPNDGVAKPGQLDAGTGTTPVIAGGGRFVGINDNADPMDVVIYRTAAHPTRIVRLHDRRRRVRARRLVCRVPVFHSGASADENAMMAAGRAYVIENNYGYTSPASVEGGQTTAPGLARVDIGPNGRGCRLVWTTYAVSAPTVVSKLSLATGLIYTYTTDPSGDWYWTAVDFRTGRVVYQQLAGSGFGYNNNYSGIAISPSGTEYLGTLGGIIAMRDGS
jgi:hypothetical protein